MNLYEVKPSLDGKEMSVQEVYDYCVKHSEVRSWQSDMFVKKNPETEKIFDACVRHGDVGEFYGWYVVYDSYMPWYEELRKNKDLQFKMRWRSNAIMDGSFYDPIKDALVGVEDG